MCSTFFNQDIRTRKHLGNVMTRDEDIKAAYNRFQFLTDFTKTTLRRTKIVY